MNSAEPRLSTRSPVSISKRLTEQGFAFVAGAQMRKTLETGGQLSDWARFTASWDDLVIDPYMADHGRYRRRRHALYEVSATRETTRVAHRAHFQTLEYNPLNGGMARWFEPVDSAIADGASMQRILKCCAQLFSALAPQVNVWQVEVHQFRIEASGTQAGLPTPEGAHRDGADYVLVLLITRRNIAQGTTHILDLQRSPLGSFTLRDPFDAALVDDARVYHGVTAVEPLVPVLPAFRDVLVVTFRRYPE